MSKNKKQKSGAAQLTQKTAPEKKNVISKRGRRAIFTGILTVVLGFFILSFADKYGDNWAAHISPFILIIGYTIIGVGIVLPEKKPSNSNPPQVGGK